jgi:hypothetical protein
MMNPPLVYVIILAWNQREDTQVCLGAVLQSTYPNFRALVVDNGSSDGTASAVRALFPQVEVVAEPFNRGFAAGANIGLNYAWRRGADYGLLLNNDAVVDSKMLAELMELRGPDVALLSPVVYHASRPEIIQASGGRRSRWTLEQIDDLCGWRAPDSWPAAVERDFLPGTAVLCSKAALAAIGGFDERFFMYYEDNDLSLRARRAGYRLLLVTGARVWHKSSVSSGGPSAPGARYARAKGSTQFFRKHVRGLQWLIVVPFRLGSAIKTTIRLLCRGEFAATSAYWQGLYDGLR